MNHLGTYGGVDGCLYAPLAKGGKSTGKVGGRKGGKSKSKSKSKRSALLESFEYDFQPQNVSLVEEWEDEEDDDMAPVQSHNLNLAGAYKIVGKLCAQLDMPESQCIPDISVFGALLSIKEAGGPDIPMTWGRQRGDCPKIITCVKDDCSDPSKALGSVPDLVKIDDASHYREEFQKLGYDAEEQVALMGAHTFGKLQVCAGGMNGLEHGPFCTDPNKISPKIGSANMMRPDFQGDTISNPGGCIPKTGEANGCWAKVAAPEKGSLGRRRRSGTSGSSKSKRNKRNKEGKKGGKTKGSKEGKSKGGKEGKTKGSKQGKRFSSLLEAEEAKGKPDAEEDDTP